MLGMNLRLVLCLGHREPASQVMAETEFARGQRVFAPIVCIGHMSTVTNLHAVVQTAERALHVRAHGCPAADLHRHAFCAFEVKVFHCEGRWIAIRIDDPKALPVFSIFIFL